MPPQAGVRRAQTRSRLLAAALDVFAERGYAGATIEQLVDRAGFTRGAFYSSFSTKEEVVLALLDKHSDTQLGRVRELVDAAAPGDALAVAAATAAEVTPDDLRWFLVSSEFTLLAVRDRQVAARLAVHDAAIRAAVARLLAAALHRSGRVPVVPLTDLASVVVALREGALMQACVDPEAVPPGHLERMFLPLLIAAGTAPA